MYTTQMIDDEANLDISCLQREKVPQQEQTGGHQPPTRTPLATNLTNSQNPSRRQPYLQLEPLQPPTLHKARTPLAANLTYCQKPSSRQPYLQLEPLQLPTLPTARTPLAANRSVVFFDVSLRKVTAGNITQMEAPEEIRLKGQIAFPYKPKPSPT